MSVSHGYSTIGGIEYGGCGEHKKEIVSHQLGKLMGYGDAQSIDIDANEQGLPCNGCTRAISVCKLKRN